MKNFWLVLLILGLVLGGTSCKRATEKAEEEPQVEVEEKVEAEVPAAEVSEEAGTPAHTGIVLATVTGGGYTYMNIEENGNKFWVVGPQTAVSKGAQVSFSEQI